MTIQTDYASLQWLTMQPHLSHQQVIWLEFMSEFDLTISPIAGKENIVADALSRCCDLDPINVAAIMMNAESDFLDTIRHAQEQDQTKMQWLTHTPYHVLMKY